MFKSDVFLARGKGFSSLFVGFLFFKETLFTPLYIGKRDSFVDTGKKSIKLSGVQERKLTLMYPLIYRHRAIRQSENLFEKV